MPGFPAIQDAELDALLAYLRTGKEVGSARQYRPTRKNCLRPEPPLLRERLFPS